MSILWNLMTWPAKGLLQVFEKIKEVAEEEMNSPELFRKRLLQLQMSYEQGEIEQQEYDAQYQELIEQIFSSFDEEEGEEKDDGNRI